MSETLWGVLIGGFLASIMPFLTLVRDERRWRKEQKLSSLRDERLRLENMFQVASEKLAEGMAKDEYPTDILMDSLYLFPHNVFDAINSMMIDSDRSFERRRSHYPNIVAAMKLALAEIDDKIAKTTGFAKPMSAQDRFVIRAESVKGQAKSEDQRAT